MGTLTWPKKEGKSKDNIARINNSHAHHWAKGMGNEKKMLMIDDE